MKTLYLTSILLLFFMTAVIDSNAQTAFKKNTVYTELIGSGGLISLNYDRRFKETTAGIGARLGMGYFAFHHTQSYNVVAMVNFLKGGNGKYFEFGIGPVIGFQQYSGDPSLPEHTVSSGFGGTGTMNIGFRYQPDGGGFNFRAGMSPFFDPFTLQVTPFWPHLSFGYSF